MTLHKVSKCLLSNYSGEEADYFLEGWDAGNQWANEATKREIGRLSPMEMLQPHSIPAFRGSCMARAEIEYASLSERDYEDAFLAGWADAALDGIGAASAKMMGYARKARSMSKPKALSEPSRNEQRTERSLERRSL